MGALGGENGVLWSSGFISNMSQCSPKSQLPLCRRGWKMGNSEDSSQGSSGEGGELALPVVVLCSLRRVRTLQFHVGLRIF